jgi:hypothetical protein
MHCHIQYVKVQITRLLENPTFKEQERTFALQLSSSFRFLKHISVPLTGKALPDLGRRFIEKNIMYILCKRASFFGRAMN